jgi:hypothetical protein
MGWNFRDFIIIVIVGGGVVFRVSKAGHELEGEGAEV